MDDSSNIAGVHIIFGLLSMPLAKYITWQEQTAIENHSWL